MNDFAIREEELYVDLEALFADRCRDDEDFACRLWGSLANVEWQKGGVGYGYTFRGAGAAVATLRGEPAKDYIHYYCCSPDSVVDPDVAAALATRGYHPETDVSKWVGL